MRSYWHVNELILAVNLSCTIKSTALTSGLTSFDLAQFGAQVVELQAQHGKGAVILGEFVEVAGHGGHLQLDIGRHDKRVLRCRQQIIAASLRLLRCKFVFEQLEERAPALLDL